MSKWAKEGFTPPSYLTSCGCFPLGMLLHSDLEPKCAVLQNPIWDCLATATNRSLLPTFGNECFGNLWQLSSLEASFLGASSGGGP